MYNKKCIILIYIFLYINFSILCMNNEYFIQTKKTVPLKRSSCSSRNIFFTHTREEN